MSLDTSAADFAFKLRYADGLDEEYLVSNKPLMQWMENDPNFSTHKGISIPVPYVNPQGIGATNADAVTAEVSSQGVSFVVPQRHVTQYGRIQSDVVRNTLNGGDPDQFTNVLEKEVDGCTESIGSEIHQRSYGDVTGIRSFLSATGAINTTTWYLANAEDAQFYEVGMRLVLVNPSTGAARSPSGGAAITISAVDSLNGTLTVSQNPNYFTSAAAGDGIARLSMVGKDLDGLNAWCPTAVSGSDSFMGVNRSVYRARLAGVYVDVSDRPIRQGLIKAHTVAKGQVGTMFKSKSPHFINPKNLGQLMQSVEAANISTGSLPDSYGLGVETFNIFGHKFVEDSKCPVDTCYLIGSGSVKRATCGKQPQIDDQDGKTFFFNRQNGYLEFVIQHDGNIVVEEPYNIMRMKLPTAAL